MPTAPRGGGGVAPRATGGGVSGYLLLVFHPLPKFRITNHPGTLTRATPPLDEELVTFPLRAEFPSIGGVAACRRGG